MSILIVGNVLKDVYLNLDTRSERLEVDRNGTKWMDLGFNASEHRYFNRNSSLGGAAVSLEVLTKLGLTANVAGSDLRLRNDGFATNQLTETYRYIVLADGQASYLVPTEYKVTNFISPSYIYDYLYVDRSASLDEAAVSQILSYLEISPDTKLIVYVRDTSDVNVGALLAKADLVFRELRQGDEGRLTGVEQSKVVEIAECSLSYQNIFEPISVERIDVMTHLSIYSIAAATVLGCFILGYSVEDSLRIAHANLENAKLNATLSLGELVELAGDYTVTDDLGLIAKNLVMYPKGILAADESGGNIHKKFDRLDIPDTYDKRRDYRNIFFTTPGLGDYVNGVILFDETTRQTADNGQTFVDYLIAQRIVPGIKVDQGLAPLEGHPFESYTKGIEGLAERLSEYYQMGLRFAKWRAAFEVRLNREGGLLTPTEDAIQYNCELLAQYAASCQATGLVPIVEPEVVYDGYYGIDVAAEVTARILDVLFGKLAEQQVNLGACILKVNMVLAGKNYEKQPMTEEIAARTAEVLKSHVPEGLAGVVFLSGGQTPEQATENLAAIVKKGPFPWPVTFSFARALQEPALEAWAGDNRNSEKAKQAFLERLKMNSKALMPSA